MLLRLSNAMRKNLVLGTLKLHLEKSTLLPLTHRLWMVMANVSNPVPLVVTQFIVHITRAALGT